MNEPFDFVEMKLPAKAEYVGVLRLTVSGIASRMGFSYEDIEDIKVALSEAITNAVKHAYFENEVGEVTVGFGLYDNRLEVMVADHGGSFNINEVRASIGPHDGTLPIDRMKEGGFGLFLIEALMDKVEINNRHGVIVIMTKFLHEDEVGRHDDQISTTQ
ncbi:anti-sigma B factor RsbW [Bacillaceae bacterium W0354]